MKATPHWLYDTNIVGSVFCRWNCHWHFKMGFVTVSVLPWKAKTSSMQLLLAGIASPVTSATWEKPDTYRHAHLALPFHQDNVRDDGRLGQSPWRFHLGSTEGTSWFLHNVVLLVNKETRDMAVQHRHQESVSHWGCCTGRIVCTGEESGDLNRYIHMSIQRMKR